MVLAGKSVEPCFRLQREHYCSLLAVPIITRRAGKLTSIDVLLHDSLDLALVGLVKPLGGQSLARGTEAAVIHGVLERVILPAKDVVTVLAVSGAFSKG